jgi:hypothetical protein
MFIAGVAATLGILVIVCVAILARYLWWAWHNDPRGKFKS